MFDKFAWSWKPQKRLRKPTDLFFESGDLICSIARKQLSLEDFDVVISRVAEFVCSVSRCAKSFTSISSYEEHYNSAHRHVCGTCSRSFPSSHLLDLHILETHDTMFQILATKQNMYQCLVEGCRLKFLSPVTRKDHLVRVHRYPASFRFNVIKKTKLKSRPNTHGSGAMQQDTSAQSHVACSPANGSTEPVCPPANGNTKPAHSPANGNAEPMEEGCVSNSATAPRRVFTYKVPKSISFGQGVSRGFQRRSRGRGKKGRHWHQQTMAGAPMDTAVDIETVKMDDLASALIA